MAARSVYCELVRLRYRLRRGRQSCGTRRGIHFHVSVAVIPVLMICASISLAALTEEGWKAKLKAIWGAAVFARDYSSFSIGSGRDEHAGLPLYAPATWTPLTGGSGPRERLWDVAICQAEGGGKLGLPRIQ